jgi:hypothetical protein
VQALNPVHIKDDSSSDGSECCEDVAPSPAMDQIFKSFKEISNNGLKILVDDFRIELLPSLSSICLVRKSPDTLNQNSFYDTTPMKLTKAGTISDNSTTGTGFK